MKVSDTSIWQKYVGGTALCKWNGKWLPVTIEDVDDIEQGILIQWTDDGKPGRVQCWELKDMQEPVSP